MRKNFNQMGEKRVKLPNEWKTLSLFVLYEIRI